MPSDSHPWDRKEAFIKDRKQERGSVCDGVVGLGGSCSTSRWREPYHTPRDCPRASPHRPFTGQHRHDGGGYNHLFPEESGGLGCTPSRAGDRFWPEEDIVRPSSGRCGGSGRSSCSAGREARGSSRLSPCLDSSGEPAGQPLTSPIASQMSPAVPITHVPSSSPSTPSKNLLDKSDCPAIEALGSGQRYDRELSLSSMSWKPLKWTRPSSLPLSKASRSETEEISLGISAPQVKESPMRSPASSHFLLDCRTPSKKPRLGWGQGLAKYEKQKVEGSADVSVYNGSIHSTNTVKEIASDLSPKTFIFPGSMSPATPTSATCSLIPDEKFPVKSLNVDTDKTQCSDSAGLGPQSLPEDAIINLDKLDSNSINTLALLLTDLVQPEDVCSGDSSVTRNSTINKLLVLKKDISKELEKTECEIDLFETKLKSINCDGHRTNFEEGAYMSPKNDAAQHSKISVDASKPLTEISSLNNCLLLESEQAIQNYISEEHAAVIKNTNHSSGSILCNNIHIPSFKRVNTSSCNIQCNDIKSQSCDAKPQMPVVMRLMNDDICSHELHYSLDYRNENMVGSLIVFITNMNKDAAKRASEEFHQAVPSGLPKFDISEFNFFQCKKNYMHIRGNLVRNKYLLEFKVRVLALKFKALHFLWREDLNLLNLRKHRPKSNKRSETNSRASNSALQKHQSSVCSRFTLPGNPTLVPTSEILNFTSKLLLDSQVRPYRNNLKMPAQIFDEINRRYSRFKSNNGLIENPPAIEKERVMVNPWMQEEKEVFLEMLATFGKDFKKISSFLSHKSVADCIEFYYKNHKSESFAEVKKQLKWRKQLQSRQGNMYLITSGARLNRDSNDASLDLLGAASLLAADSSGGRRNSQKQSAKPGFPDTRFSRRSNGALEKSNCEISGNEREVAAADVLAGICGALSSDALSSCITSSIDPSEKMHFTANDHSLTAEAAHTIDEEETCSDESSDEMESADWTDEEKSLFIRALSMYGKDFVKVAHFVRTRSRDQCKIFFSKARKCLSLDVINNGSANGVMPLSDVNGGRSDTEDACAAEIDSAICSTQSCSKMDVESTQSMLKTCSEGHTQTCNIVQQVDVDRPCEQRDVGASIPDEGEGKLEIKASADDEEKVIIGRGDIDVGKDHAEVGCSVLRNSESEHVHKAAEFVNAETNNENDNDKSAAGKSAVKFDGEIELKLLSTDGTSQNASCGVTVADELNKVNSNMSVGQQNSVIEESNAHVKIDETADAGDFLFSGSKPPSNGKPCNDREQKNDECTKLPVSSRFQHNVPLELLCPLQKGPETEIVQPEACLPPARLNCVLPDSSPIPLKEAGKEAPVAILNLQDGDKKPRPEPAGRGDCSLFPNHVDSSLHIAALPSSAKNDKYLNTNGKLFDGSLPFEISVMANNTTTQAKLSLLTELNSDNKHVGTAEVLTSRPGSSLPSRPERQSDRYFADAVYDACQSSESEDQLQRVGDLKLFGQILTHPSSQKPASSLEGNTSSSSPRRSNASATANSSSCWKDAAIFAPFRPGRNGKLHHQQPGEMPQRSYGFWDGNRIQTGFSSLPEPAAILAKYQGPLTVMPFGMPKESAAASSDFQQQLQLQPQPETESLSSHKYLENYPETQKKNGFDLLSSFQQQGRILRLGVNHHYSGRNSSVLSGDLESLMGGDAGGR